MIIKQILNNSAVIAEKGDGTEAILLGKGIAFNQKIGNEIDKSKIYKIFSPNSEVQRKNVIDTIHEIEPIYFEISQKICERLKREENIKLTDSVYITLTDHLATSVERAKKGLYLSNKFLWDIKDYYPKEYNYGLWALRLLNQQFDVDLPEDEAAFIAIHLISGELGQDIDEFQRSMNFIKEITKLVRHYFRIDLDNKTLNYKRFAVHLKFFWQRMMYEKGKKSYGDLSQEVLEVIKESDIDAYLCALKIKDYIKQQYKYDLNTEEIMYLAIHINKITSGEKKMKYDQMIEKILPAIGGEENISSVVHCATRLRFVLKDESKADDEAVKNIPGILQLVKKAGQYQLVIGNDVGEVYAELMQKISVSDSESPNQEKGTIFDRIIRVITGSIAPAIPLLAGAGMGKVLLLILTMSGILAETSQTYQILNLIFDTGYFFMPAFVAFSAAKVFKTDQYLGAFMGLVTVHPIWTDLVKAAKPVDFIGLPVQLIKYSGSLITAILSVWIMSYIYKGVKKVTPGMVKVFMEPMLTMLITAPLIFLVIGPVSNTISEAIASLSMWLFNNVGIIAILVLAAVYPWLVSVGVHKALSPISIQLVATQGFDPIIRVVALCSNISQAAASLAVGLKTKDKKLKSLALSSSATAYLGGITEPALFGVNLPLKKPMYGAMIGSAVAGLVAGFLKLKAFIYVTPAILSLPMWVSKSENFVLQAITVMVIASVATFIATWMIGFDDPAQEESGQQIAEKDGKHELHSPVVGKLE